MIKLPAVIAITFGVAAPVEQWWHITDTHLDPYYTAGAFPGSGCFCETHDACPRMPLDCTIAPSGSGAGPFGESQANCATPVTLWESALEFMAITAPGATLVFHTGDHGEAGLSSACSSESTAQEQIVGILTRSMAGLRAALPNARVFSVLGNHDGAPGDVFDAGPSEDWLYNNLTTIFGASFPDDAMAISTLRKGGYYSTMARPGLRVLALNTNYFTTLNPLLANSSSAAAAACNEQLDWINSTLAAAAGSGDAVIVIGHIPPHGAWQLGVFSRYRALLTKYPGVVRAQLFGHEHVDETTIVRSCTLRANDGNATREYIVTRGVEWCSGSNYNVGDVFDAGLGGGDAWCPILPGGISDERGAHLCEEVCSNASACAGFTLYPNASGLSGGAQCCFRESLTSMPRNESSPAVCYAKAGGPSVSSHCIEDGGSQPPAPLHLLFTGPSLTEGYPPSDSAIRLWTVDAESWQLTDGDTFRVDISAANAAGAAVFEHEYGFRSAFSMPDLSPVSWEAVTQRMNDYFRDNGTWGQFHRYYYKNFSAAPPCAAPVCANFEISYLNGTSGVDL